MTVPVLAEDRYADHGVFGRGQHARSACLPDCSLDVTSLFRRAVTAWPAVWLTLLSNFTQNGKLPVWPRFTVLKSLP